MQMMILLVGFGAGIPKTNLGVGFGNMGHLFFRHNKFDNKEKALRIVDLISIGQKSGAFLLSAVQTDWFVLDPKKDNWAHNINSLIGKKIEVELSGFQVVRGESDLSLKIFDEYNDAHELINRCCIKSRGLQFSSIKIRGVLGKSSFTSENIGEK